MSILKELKHMSRVSYEIDLEYRMKKIFMCRKCNYYV